MSAAKAADAHAMSPRGGRSRLVLPCDAVVSDSLDAPLNVRIVPLTPDCCGAASPCLPDGAFGVDIGPASTAEFAEHIGTARTVLWNGARTIASILCCCC